MPKKNMMAPGQKAKDFKGTFRRLYQFLKPYRKGLFFVVIATFLSSLFNTLGPFMLGNATDAIADIFIDDTGALAGMKKFFFFLVVLASVYLLSALFRYGSMYVMSGVSQKTMYDLRQAVDDKLQKLPLQYYDSHAYGDILSRVTNDVDTISTSLQQSIDQLLNSIASVIFIITMMLVVSPWLTLIAMLTVPFTALASALIVKKSQPFFRGQQKSLGQVNGYVEEMYEGHTVIKAFDKEADTIQTFETLNDTLYENSWKAQFCSSIMMPVTQFLTNIGYVAVVIVGAVQVMQGTLTIGKIQSFIQYLRQFSMPITQTAQIANILQATAAAAERVFEFLDAEEEIPEAEPAQFPAKVTGHVEFKQVVFGYNPEKPLMKHLNIDIKPGSKVAIVGPTGAGKTTLVNLLLRFYDVNSGSILIDGVDIREMKREKLRSLFGMVLQDTWLFQGTILENIRYGKLDATDQEVEQAAFAAHAHGFIKNLPNGYHMMLNENGTNLAQGQRQLITIARAILSDAPIMILDEATSSVDTRTEVAIQKALQNLMKNRTSFIIAHRLSTIRDANLILFMSEGDIKETGTHEELLQKQGYYAKLYESQFAENNAS